MFNTASSVRAARKVKSCFAQTHMLRMLHVPHVPHLAPELCDAMAVGAADGAPITIVPVLVGALSAKMQAKYGEVFARYLDDEANFFVADLPQCRA